MYKIIGGDGREYGPVSADQLRQWIAEGRINAQTQVLPEGATTWQPLTSLPEYAAMCAPTPAMTTSTTSSVETLDIGSCISRSWELVKANLGLVIASCLLFILIVGGVGLVLRFGVNLVTGVTFRDLAHSNQNPLEMLRLQWKGLLLQQLWHLLVVGPMTGGFYMLFLKLIRGQTASVGDLFSGFGSQFGSLVLGYFVMALLTIIGFLLCLIPGIYLSVAWKFTLPAIVDKKLGFWEAMEASRKAVAGRWWIVFALVLVSGLIGAAGVFACCVGLLFTVPIAIGAIACAYEDLIGRTSA